jgi:hypothetical protein
MHFFSAIAKKFIVHGHCKKVRFEHYKTIETIVWNSKAIELEKHVDFKNDQTIEVITLLRNVS